MLFCLISVAIGFPVPIPRRETGLAYGIFPYELRIDAYVDPLCDECAGAWQTMANLLSSYPSTLQIRAHLQPLPFHTWSFVIVRSICAVRNLSESLARQFLTNLFSGDQTYFKNDALADKSQNEVISLVGDYVQSTLYIAKSIFLSIYNSSDIFLAARIEYKDSTEHGACNVPSFFVNGVETSIDSSYSLSSWQSLLNSLL